MTANFKELQVEVTFDTFKQIDVTANLGNYLHANTSDIGLDDVARSIYYSKGGVDVPDEYVPIILDMIKSKSCPLVVAVKRAIIKELEK